MSDEKREIGELSLKIGAVTVEWKIKRFLSYIKEDESYDSPTFSVPGSQWYLQVYPYGEHRNDSVGWISLYLRRVQDSTYPKRVVYSLGVKKVDGTVLKMGVITRVFKNTGERWGFPKILSREELKAELMPLDSFTVTCTLQPDDNMEATSALMKLSRDIKDVYISQRCPDATLRVKNKDLSVHRAILGCRSPVFRSMFEVNMKEKNTGVVEIVDFSPEVFQDFIIYLYCGQFENNSKKEFELYRIADKYAVDELKSKCVDSMISNLTIDNVLDAHQFGENELKVKSQEFFNQNFSQIADTPQWDLLLNTNRKLANELLKKMAVK